MAGDGVRKWSLEWGPRPAGLRDPLPSSRRPEAIEEGGGEESASQSAASQSASQSASQALSSGLQSGAEGSSARSSRSGTRSGRGRGGDDAPPVPGGSAGSSSLQASGAGSGSGAARSSRRSSTSGSGSGSSSSSTSSSSSSPRRGAQDDRPLDAPMELASDKSGSMRSATEAGEGDEALESDPLLPGGRPGRSSMMSSEITGSVLETGVLGTYVDEEEAKELERQRQACRRRAFQVLCCFCCIGMVAGSAIEAWRFRHQLRDLWERYHPMSCTFSDWSDWGPCSTSCGVGLRTATRTFSPSSCKPKPWPGDLRHSRGCELRACGGRSCRVGSWGTWGECSEPCGPGQRTRLRPVLDWPDSTGGPCPALSQRAVCQLRSCSPLCHITPWTTWTPCTRTCGLGTKSRTRTSRALEQGALCPRSRESIDCELSQCTTHCHFDLPPEIPHAIEESLLQCDGTESGASCHFACEEGMQPDEPLVCVGGIFLRGPRCFPRSCRQPPMVQDSVGLEVCHEMESGSTCLLTCRAGFRKTGDLVCHAGSWSRERCEELPCAEPSPVPHSLGGHRNISHCRHQKSGQTCSQFACEEGYAKTEDLVCKGVNFNHPRCEEAPCHGGPPAIENSVLDVEGHCRRLAHRGEPLASRTVCVLKCQEGYAKTGETVCVRGDWRPAQCLPEAQVAELRRLGQVPGACSGDDAPVVSGALPTTCDGAQSGQVCAVKCAGDLQKTGDLLCAGGEWLEPACSGRPCNRQPVLEHAMDVTACRGARAGDACRLECGPGFEAPQSELRCNDGHWTGPRCLPLNCSLPPVPRYAVGSYSSCAGLRPGEWCPLRCEEGHSAKPAHGFECQSGGRFSRASCVPKPCDNLPMVLHSVDLAACRGAPSGSFCELRCAPGYRPAGDLYCAKGRWTEATCNPRPSCQAVPAIPHAVTGLYDCIDMPSGEACGNFSCEAGFEPSGELRCQAGHFSRPRCGEARCMKAPIIENTRPGWSCAAMDSGGVCPVVCKDGYAKTNDLVCRHGLFCCAACLDLRDAAVRKTSEVLSVELQVPGTYQQWIRREPGTALAARLATALAKAAGISTSRVVERGTRPLTISSAVVDLDILPAASIVEPSAQEAADAVMEVFREARTNFSAGVGAHADATLRHAKELRTRAVGLPALLGSTGELRVARHGAGRLCREVPRVLHAGDLSMCANTLSGGRCLLLCKDGYVRTGDLYCMMGKWTRAACVGAPCSEAPKVNNSEDLSHCKGAASGSSCVLDCQAGYGKTGDLECHLGAWWPGPACLPQGCRHTPLLPLGARRELVECRGMASGQECTLRCAPGHLPDGRGILRCERGNWRRLGACRPAACFYAPAILHAATDLTACAGTQHGQECPFACEPGFARAGRLRCHCGRFEEAHCEPLACSSPPAVPGLDTEAAFRCVPAALGQACHARCISEHQMLSAPLLCRRGAWSAVACVRKVPLRSCDYPPSVAHAADVMACMGRFAGESCEVQCDPGYRLVSPPFCANGTWTQSACEPSRCEDAPTVPHSEGLHACAGLDSGSLCPLPCLSGYAPAGLPAFAPDVLPQQNVTQLVAASSLVCHEGKWHGPTCKEVPCDSAPPGVAHARGLDRCAGTPSRQECHIECEYGFIPLGYPQCVKGIWLSMDLAQCEEAPCTDFPNVSHAQDLAHCVNRRSGKACHFECEGGYEPTGELLCFRGSWLPVHCVARCYAPPLFVLHAGDLAHCAGTRAGDFCPLACAPGFRPSGDLRCLDAGHWEESAYCYDAESLGKAVSQRFELSGLHVSGDSEFGRARGSLCESFAELLRITRDLLSVELQKRPGGSLYDAELRVLCGGPGCTGLPHRFHALLDAGDLASSLRAGLCTEACGLGQDEACRNSCVERLRRLRAHAEGKAQVVAAPIWVGVF